MKKIHLIIIVLTFLALSGCASKNSTSFKPQEEVLLAQDCGFDRLPCCSSNPVCNFSQQCCADPNNHNRNYCADNCSCGKADEFCCEGSKCSEGLSCRDGLCVKCGGDGEFCCPQEASCLPNLACLKDRCVPCGLAGNPCCAGAETCFSKKGENNECFEGLCRACGFDGAAGCKSEIPCLKGQILTGGRCERCGDLAKPCCNPDSGTGYDCDGTKNLRCELGFCSEIK